MHGGSDNPDEEIRQACAIGIQKVNISSDIKQTFFRTLQATLDETHGFLPPKMYGPAIAQTRSTVHAKWNFSVRWAKRPSIKSDT